MRGLSSVVVGFGASAALLAASGCGSSSAPLSGTHANVTPAPAAAASVVGGVSAQSVERALTTHGRLPRPTGVACRVSSAAERSATPFGPTHSPLFTCELTLTGERASYLVQVLHNGCFVAERRRPGRAVYGCGVGRS